MADDKDEAQKTEEPSAKKLEDAAKKGDAARSQEVRHWFMFLGIALALSTSGSWFAYGLESRLGNIFAQSWDITVDKDNMIGFFSGLLRDVGGYMMIPVGIFLIAGLAGSVLQNKPVFSTEKIVPKLSKISPIAGLKRMFSSQSLMEFFKTILKFVIVGSVVVVILWPERELLSSLISESPESILMEFTELTMKIIIGVVSVMTLLAAMDYTYQRMQFTKRMRMTKQEVKDEHKQLDGDPHVKARIRQVRAERARTRMMASVPNADVVVTNPTHYAVALEYKHGNMQVPKVLAKGMDFIALKIREIAEEHKIPIVENPPLARSLFATAEIDEEIPSSQYKAVAGVISYILKLKKRGKSPIKRPR